MGCLWLFPLWLLFVVAGGFALDARPEVMPLAFVSVPIATGALAGVGAGLLQAGQELLSRKLAAAMNGLLVCGVAIFLVVQVNGALAWIALFFASLLVFPIIFITNCLMWSPLQKTWKALRSDPGDRPSERFFVRLFVPLALIGSVVFAYEIASDIEPVPGIAFHDPVVFGGLLCLLTFYGLLLIALPLARAIFTGELPIELTTKGPRYPEKELAISRAATEGLEDELKRVKLALEEEIEQASASASKGVRALNERVQDLDASLGELAEKT